MGAYTGAWRTRVMGVTDNVAPLGAADSTHHMQDWDVAAHGVDNNAVARLNVKSSMRADYPPDTVYDSTDEAYGLASAPSSMPSDMEPFDHGITEYDCSTSNPRVHGMPGDVVIPVGRHYLDRGVPWLKKYETPRLVQSDQVDTTKRINTNSGATSNSTAQLKIGAYGYDAMNPVANEAKHTPFDAKGVAGTTWQGSTHEGKRVQVWRERKISMRRWSHTPRPMVIKLAHTANDSPAGNSVYVSPFDANAQSRFGNYMTPLTRRQPQAFDESAINNGDIQAAVPTETLTSWGL